MDNLEEWSEWIEFIKGEVRELCVVRDVYKELLDFYRRNPVIQRRSIFYSWMRGLFVAWSVSSIGRLVDDTRGTRSFVKLLKSIHKTSHRISREHHSSVCAMRKFREGQEAAAIANREFDRLVGSAHKFLPKSQVEGDIAALVQAAKPIKDFRNERVAHIAENPSEQLPTYEDLDKAISKLGELLEKYSLLIKVESPDVFLEIQDDWRAIFRVPWIVGHRRRRR